MKPEKQKEYAKYVEINKSPYSKAVIDAGEGVMKLLDGGKNPEEAEKGLYGFGITGYQSGAAIQAVVHFHERGEEMRAWWNNKHGVKSNDGTVNPAIMTIDI